MQKVHSHYENLKVARDASVEEIRTAYRALTRQHHPDRNPGNPDAQRVMAVINVAYGVLSDPAKRKEHDLWIAESEAVRARPIRHGTTLHSPSRRFHRTGGRERPPLDVRQARFNQRLRRTVAHLRRNRIGYGLGAAAACCGLVALIFWLLAPGLRSPLMDATAASQRVAGYTRPAMAPNGRPWPAHSGYVDGYPQLNKGGFSDVLVDNAENDTDMFAKLVALDGPTALPVRSFFVAAHSRFKLSGLASGTYDMRYRNLASGNLARSPVMILEEVATSGGIQHSHVTVKLYQAATGNMLSYSLPESDF